MKKIKIALLLIILIILIHFLPNLYKNRIPSHEYNTVRIEGAIIVYIPGNIPYDETYYVLDGILMVKSNKKANSAYEGFIEEKLKRRRKIDSVKVQEKINFLNKQSNMKCTIDSILFSPSYRFGLKLELDWRVVDTRKIIDLSSGNIVMEIPVWSTIYPPRALAWSTEEEKLAMSISDTIHEDGEYGLIILDLSSKNKKYFKFDRSIESIDWSPSSKELAVITQEVRYAYCPINLLFRLSGHNLLYWSYYLTIINVETDFRLEIPIVKDTERSCCAKVYWLK